MYCTRLPEWPSKDSRRHVSKLARKTEEVGHVVGDLIRHGVRLLDTATEEFFVVGD